MKDGEIPRQVISQRESEEARAERQQHQFEVVMRLSLTCLALVVFYPSSDIVLLTASGTAGLLSPEIARYGINKVKGFGRVSLMAIGGLVGFGLDVVKDTIDAGGELKNRIVANISAARIERAARAHERRTRRLNNLKQKAMEFVRGLLPLVDSQMTALETRLSAKEAELGAANTAYRQLMERGNTFITSQEIAILYLKIRAEVVAAETAEDKLQDEKTRKDKIEKRTIRRLRKLLTPLTNEIPAEILREITKQADEVLEASPQELAQQLTQEFISRRLAEAMPQAQGQSS